MTIFSPATRLPTWSLLLSIVATETSTVTFLSVPGKSFVERRQLHIPATRVRLHLRPICDHCFLVAGIFSRRDAQRVSRAGKRFGLTTRRLASLVFLVTRNLADGLRLFLSALALEHRAGVRSGDVHCRDDNHHRHLFMRGGVRSVVWNDCVQFAVYMAGRLRPFGSSSRVCPAGGRNSLNSASRRIAGSFSTSIRRSRSRASRFGRGCWGGAFLSLATHGVDQMIVQRDVRHATGLGELGFGLEWVRRARAICVVSFDRRVAGLFLFRSNGGSASPTEGDKAFMTFVVDHMGVGFKGLILAAVLAATMSNLSSSFNSSASSLMSDWLGRWLPTDG